MKTLSIAMLLMGTIIGAGFASGREILSFFGEDIPFYIAPICGLLIFGCSVLFLVLSQRLKSDNISEVNAKVMGKAHVLADIFLLFNNLVVLFGMLAGMDSLFSIVLPIAPAYSIISGILCALIVAKGLKGLLNSNMIIMPLIIVMIVLICCFSVGTPQLISSFKGLDLPAIVLYVSMNMMLASTVFTSVKGLKLRQILVSSGIAAFLITVLMMLIILMLNSTGSRAAMPLMEVAKSKSIVLFYVALIAVAASIFTTMTTAMSGLTQWLKTLIGDTKYSVILVLLTGLILSNLGFENVVKYLYPVIGGLGAVYILICLIYLIRDKRRGRAMPAVGLSRKSIKEEAPNRSAFKRV